jgi:hypothetical protein
MEDVFFTHRSDHFVCYVYTGTDGIPYPMLVTFEYEPKEARDALLKFMVDEVEEQILRTYDDG